MLKLRIKLALFNLLSKVVFTVLFILFLPFLVERINLLQVDTELIEKREKVIDLITQTGIEHFITNETGNAFVS